MKYIIVGYTSDINIKTNTAKVRYMTDTISWSDKVADAYIFNTRLNADHFIEAHKLHRAVSYGLEE